MGNATGAPINEAVHVLSLLDPMHFLALREEFPNIAHELRVGQIGGGPTAEGSAESHDVYDLERAEVAARALTAVAKRATAELVKIERRMGGARRKRLVSQILTLVFSSGILASLAMKEATVAVTSAVLTLIASVGNLLADYSEKLLKPGHGDVYEAFEQASNANYEAERLADEIRLKLRHKIADAELVTLVTSANQVSATLNGWVVKMAGSS